MFLKSVTSKNGLLETIYYENAKLESPDNTAEGFTDYFSSFYGQLTDLDDEPNESAKSKVKNTEPRCLPN